MTGQDLAITVMSMAFTAVTTAAATAFGVSAALRERVDKIDIRVSRTETKIGITHDGSLTGNGLIGEVQQLKGGYGQ